MQLRGLCSSVWIINCVTRSTEVQNNTDSYWDNAGMMTTKPFRGRQTNPSLKFNFYSQLKKKKKITSNTTVSIPRAVLTNAVGTKGENNSEDQVQLWIEDWWSFSKWEVALQQWLFLHCIYYFLPPTTTSTSGPGRVSATTSPVLLLLVLFLRHGFFYFTLQERQHNSYFQKMH